MTKTAVKFFFPIIVFSVTTIFGNCFHCIQICSLFVFVNIYFIFFFYST